MIEKRVFEDKEKSCTAYFKNAFFNTNSIFDFEYENGLLLSDTSVYYSNDTYYSLLKRYFRIFYPYKGRFYISIDKKKHLISPGEYAIINPGIKFSKGITQPGNGISKLKIISFPINIFEDILNEQGMKIPSDGLVLDGFIKDKTNLLEYFILALFQGAENGFFEDELFLESMLRELTLYLLHTHKGNYKDLIIDNRKDIRIKKAVEFIKDNYARKFSLGELAKESGLSKDHLIKLFKKEIGKTPWQYLNYCRVEKAKELLNNPNKTIGNICNELGLSNMTYFERIFLKYTNLTPSGFRKQFPGK